MYVGCFLLCGLLLFLNTDELQCTSNRRLIKAGETAQKD